MAKEDYFPTAMGKNRLRFFLSIMRFDDKATRADRLLNDKLAAFREIWDIFLKHVIQCTWEVLRSALMNSYFHSKEEVLFSSSCLKNQASMESKFG